MPEENQAGDTKGQRNKVTPPNQLNEQDFVLLMSIQLGSAVHRTPNLKGLPRVGINIQPRYSPLTVSDYNDSFISVFLSARNMSQGRRRQDSRLKILAQWSPPWPINDTVMQTAQKNKLTRSHLKSQPGGSNISPHPNISDLLRRPSGRRQGST
ncbi:hypothetical protein PABG_11612 [Paracoccidioides brasiliensis Pb03]|nr:hypothetical protein PABG_11612 [Paracoccidioides brasiliensis Pb03]